MKERSCGWHQVAFDLRQQGLAPPDIARRVGRNLSTVKWVLNENNEREKTSNRVKKSRGLDPHYASRLSPGKRRVDALGLCREFAAGRIDRLELSRRLRGDL